RRAGRRWRRGVWAWITASLTEPSAHSVEEAAGVGGQGDALLESQGELSDAEAGGTSWGGQREGHSLDDGSADVFIGDHMAGVEHVNTQEILCHLGDALVNLFGFGDGVHLVDEEADSAVDAVFRDDFDDGVGVR